MTPSTHAPASASAADAGTPQSCLMQLADVRFSYHRGKPVVDGLSASVHAGKFHVLLGPNAAGKTTLVKLMMGQLAPERGRILLEGQRVRRHTAADRAAWMSYVPQRSTVGFAFNVAQVVAMGRYALPWSAEAMRQALAKCELTELADQPYNELSVGQQQRVMLARALAQCHGEGRVMLLDEPVSAMDLSHVHRAMRTLGELTAGGMAVVAVVHDLNLAARYADEVWLIDSGRMVAQGPWQEVLQPEVLEPVYGVAIRTLSSENRPVFDVQLRPHGQ